LRRDTVTVGFVMNQVEVEVTREAFPWWTTTFPESTSTLTLRTAL
jgi:hypothetical protein